MTRLDDEVLVAYADGELSGAEAEAVERALADQPAARARLEALRRSTTLLRAALAERRFGDVPDSLQRTAARFTAPRSRRDFLLPLAAAVAGLAIGVGGYAALTSYASRRAGGGAFAAMLDEIASYHVLFEREDEHLVEVGADRRSHIEAWLGERLGQSLSVPDLTARNLEFRGARLLAIDGRPVAQLMYLTPQRVAFAVCLMSQPGGGAAAAALVERGETRLLSWARGDALVVLVGRVPERLIRDVAADLAAWPGRA